MEWVEKKSDMPPDVHVSFGDIGAGFVDHNLTCFLCGESPAIWYGSPLWHFAPCEACQNLYDIVDFRTLSDAAMKKTPWYRRLF
jgi:hypothetical protein